MVREFDQTTADERRKIEAFKNTPEYPEALAAVIAFAEEDYGRVLWCKCVYHSPGTRDYRSLPEAFVFRVFVPNDGTFVESIPEMTTLIGWLPATKKVHGYYQDIFPHPWDSNMCESSELLSEAAKARRMKRAHQEIGMTWSSLGRTANQRMQRAAGRSPLPASACLAGP